MLALVFILERTNHLGMVLEMAVGSYMFCGGSARTWDSQPRYRLAKGDKGEELNKIQRAYPANLIPGLRFYSACVLFLELSIGLGGKDDQHPWPVLQRTQRFQDICHS